MAFDPVRSIAARNAALASTTALINTGGAGTLNIYSGSKPTGPDTAITSQVLLVTLTFSATSFGTPSNGVATANAITAGNPVANGTATWARIASGGGTPVIDLTVGTSGTDVIIGSTTIAVGTSVTASSATLTQP